MNLICLLKFFIMRRFKTVMAFLSTLLVLGSAGCSKRNYNVDAETQVLTKPKGGIFKRIQNNAPATAAIDTANSPSLVTALDTTQQAVKKHKKTKKRKIFSSATASGRATLSPAKVKMLPSKSFTTSPNTSNPVRTRPLSIFTIPSGIVFLKRVPSTRKKPALCTAPIKKP